MPSCQSINFTGNRCSRKADESDYFIFHDSMGRCTKLFHLCHDDSNRILGQLMQKELGYTRLLDSLKKKIDNLRVELNKGHNISEEREKIRQSREEGRPAPKFKSVEKLNHEIKELYLKRSKFFDIRQFERNAVCRFCGFPLLEPEFPHDQISNKFLHANFHSNTGKRRADIMFHSECAMTWLANTIHLDKDVLQYIQPKLTGQHTLFSF